MTYDVAVIGAGPGGYVAAIRAAQLGLKVVCIDKGATLGGTCLNVGCIPSKVLLHDSEHSTDFAKMMARKSEVVKGFTDGIAFLLKKNKVDHIRGEGRLKGGVTIEVDGKAIDAKYIILAMGSTPVTLPFLPIDETKILTSTGALALKQVPKKLLVIGAGVIGVELGSVYQRLGSEVIFIEFADRLCAGFDRSISQGLEKLLIQQGMKFHFSHKVLSAKGTTLTVQGPSSTFDITGDAILVAVGRRPLSDGFNLAKDAKGFIIVDDSFRTSQPNIFAIGDLIDGPMLAHKASEEGVAVAELIAGMSPTVHYASIPGVIYTHPEAAAVGLTEEEVKARSLAYKVSQFPFKANSRARCIDDADGFVKMIAEEKTGRLLGVHILGPNASELIATAALAMTMKATAQDLAHTPFAHPTLSESMKEAALGLFGKAIHV